MSTKFFQSLSAYVLSMVKVGIKSSTHYLAPDLVTKITVRGRPRKGARQIDTVVTVGRPNYVERRFIAAAKKAGVKFQVRKTQVKKAKR